MDEFNKGIALIQAGSPSEINGNLQDYFIVTRKDDGRYALKWEKKVSTHIRHKVAALVKLHYVAK